MAAIHVGIDTDDWLKVEREGWVGTAGWVLLAIGVLLLPFRMYPLFWCTGLKVESLADPILVLGIAAAFLLAAMVMFSQPRSASAERDAAKIVIATGFTTVQETEIPFADVAAVTTGAHPLWPLARRVVVKTKGGKVVPFAWTGDARQAKELAAKLGALAAGGGAGTAAPAQAEATGKE